jgi:hypothetical protein
MQRQQSLVQAVTFHNVKTTPDMRGDVDHLTWSAAINLFRHYGLSLTRNASGHNNDVDFMVLDQNNSVCGFLEVEKAMSFYNGEYHSPRYDAISIPARKIPVLQLPNTYWLCFSKELTHFIMLQGSYILTNSHLSSYYTRKQSLVKETFLMVPKHMVTIQQLPALLTN